MGDIVALGAVASGEGSDEGSVFVSDGEGYAVDFGFAGEGGGGIIVEEGGGIGGLGAEGFVHSIDPLFDFLLVVGVVDGEHGGWVWEGVEAVDGVAAYAGGGGVWVLEFWVGLFEGLEFFEEAVEFGVGHEFLVACVVGGVGAGEEGAEVFDFCFSVAHMDMIRGICGRVAMIGYERTVDRWSGVGGGVSAGDCCAGGGVAGFGEACEVGCDFGGIGG